MNPHSRGAALVALPLRYRPPYDWDALLSFLAARAIPGVEHVSGGRYARTISIGGQTGTVLVRPGTGGHLLAEVRFPDPTALSEVEARLGRVFDIAADPAAIGAHLGRDKLLAPLVAARPGLRVPGAWDGFELAIRAVLGQQITVAAARGLAGRLVTAYGESLPEPLEKEGLWLVFPGPERIASADLAALGMPRSRASALASLARAVAADPGLLDPTDGSEAPAERLQLLPGIGPWTAQYIAMRAFREPDAFPAADIGVLRALAAPGGARPSPAAVTARAEAWRPWRAYAVLHLWTGAG